MYVNVAIDAANASLRALLEDVDRFDPSRDHSVLLRLRCRHGAPDALLTRQEAGVPGARRQWREAARHCTFSHAATISAEGMGSQIACPVFR